MTETGPDSEATRRFLENMRKAAEAESVEARAREWRGASEERHAKTLADLLDLADAIIESRGIPPRKEPLPIIKMRGSRLPALRL